MGKNWVGLCLCCSVLWNVELVRDEIGYLTEEISKKSVKGLACPHLTTVVKCKEREMT